MILMTMQQFWADSLESVGATEKNGKESVMVLKEPSL